MNAKSQYMHEVLLQFTHDLSEDQRHLVRNAVKAALDQAADEIEARLGERPLATLAESFTEVDS